MLTADTTRRAEGRHTRARAMNLLFLEQQPSFGGGSERMSFAVCQHALARGHRAWLAHASPGDMVQAYTEAGAVCHRRPIVPIAVREPLTAWRSFAHLKQLVVRERIDVLFTSQVNFVSLLAAVGAASGAKTAVHLGLTYDYPSPIFRTGMRFIDLAVAPSSHTAAEWRARHWPESSLRVIPNGVDTTRFHAGADRSAERRRIGLPDAGGPLIAYVGRLVADKGIFTLLRAFARYRRDGGQGRLLFSGPAPGDEVARLTALATEEGVRIADWQVRPPTAEPEQIYRAADLVVCPSEGTEAFGLVPLEAMACGTLALVSDLGVLPEFVAAVGPEAVFRSADAGTLSMRLRYWLSHPERREAAAARAARDVRSRYAFDACGDAYLLAFRGLLAR